MQGGRLHVLPAVKQGHALTATFQLPSLFQHYGAKAEDYVSHLVGHEGAGSLLSALKAKGCAQLMGRMHAPELEGSPARDIPPPCDGVSHGGS